ncbi:MAG: serine kinase [Pseudomonadota bacterium]
MSSLSAGPIHGSAVAVDGKAALILGVSGSGKSSLVAEIMSRGGTLIGDDQVVLSGVAHPIVKPAPQLAGLLELRGIGLVRVPFQERAPLYLCVNLDVAPDGRMPDRCTITVLGKQLPLINAQGLQNVAASVILTLRGTLVET